jgi:hypothetical protein
MGCPPFIGIFTLLWYNFVGKNYKDGVGMKNMLMEVDTDKCELKTMGGSVFSVNPGDITICCTWIPTAELNIMKNANTTYDYTITNGQSSILAMKMK